MVEDTSPILGIVVLKQRIIYSAIVEYFLNKDIDTPARILSFIPGENQIWKRMLQWRLKQKNGTILHPDGRAIIFDKVASKVGIIDGHIEIRITK